MRRSADTIGSARPDPLRLTALGLSPPTESLYRLVLSAPGLAVGELASRLDRPASDVSRRLGHLLRLELVRYAAGGVVPQPPDRPLRQLVNTESRRLVDEQTAFAAARMAVPDVVAEFQAAEQVPVVGGPVETVPRGGSLPALMDLLRNTDGELAFLRPGDWAGDAVAALDDLVTEQVTAGRAARVIYPVSVLTDMPAEVLARSATGERVRVLPELGTALVLCGTAAAMTTARWGSTAGARVIVRQGGLVSALRELFDAMWKRAVVPAGLGEEVVGDQRRQLLSLLMNGAIDQQIARATGVSLRTVRRRVAALMDELGASSRFGAGAEAVRRGWL